MYLRLFCQRYWLIHQTENKWQICMPFLKYGSPKNTKNAFLAWFWAYVGQPHDHISRATPMPFASIRSTNPRINPWNFHDKILRIGGAGKWGFFELAIFFIFFCFISIKQAARSYEVSFISALWMFFSESLKRLHPN